MQPKVSVIVPVYNTAPYLRQCLDSVVSQTLKEIEIICVDDGSTDKSLDILKEYAQNDERFHIMQQKNKGGGAARNLGMSIAKGKYLSFLDSDDFFELDLLESALMIGELGRYDVIQYKYRKYNNNTKYVSRTEFGFIYSYFNNNNKKYISSHVPWDKLFLKSFIINNSLQFSETKHGNDNAFVISAIYLSDKLGYLNKSLVYYRINQNTNTQSTTYKEPNYIYQVSLDILNNLKKSKIWHSIKPDVINKIFDMNMSVLEIYITQKHQDAYESLLSQLSNGGFDVLGITEYNHKHFFNEWYYNKFYLKIIKNKSITIPKNVYLKYVIKIYYYIIYYIYHSQNLHLIFTSDFWNSILNSLIDLLNNK